MTMADNVTIVGTVVAADEVSDGTLGTVKVQYVKIMDGTLDGTNKAQVGASGLSVLASQNGSWSVAVPTLAASAPSFKSTAPGVGTFVSDGSGWQPAINPIGAGATTSGSGLAAGTGYLFNGVSYERQRTPSVWKDVGASGVLATVWTPASGKTIRFMGGHVSAASGVSLLFEDNTNGNFVFRTPILTANVPFSFALGNGIPMSGANRTLKVTQTPNSPVVTFTGTVYGTEE